MLQQDLKGRVFFSDSDAILETLLRMHELNTNALEKCTQAVSTMCRGSFQRLVDIVGQTSEDHAREEDMYEHLVSRQ